MASFAPAITNPPGGALSSEVERYRVIISTDIGASSYGSGDYDDFQSLVHLLQYADVLEIEGLIASRPTGEVADINLVLEEYGNDLAKLKTHSPNYPSKLSLQQITKQGATTTPYSSSSPATPGSELIVDAANRPDPRPLYILVWGSLTDVAQAVRNSPGIKSKIRVVATAGSSGYNHTGDPAAWNYLYGQTTGASPTLWMISMNTSFRGMYITGWTTGSPWGNGVFVTGTSTYPASCDGHGFLGEFMTALPGHGSQPIKAGDTPTVLYMLRGNPSDPAIRHWGGHYYRPDTSNRPNYWTDLTSSEWQIIENVNGVPTPRYGAKTVADYRDNFMSDWAARMDRCKDANSNPPPTVNITAPLNGAPAVSAGSSILIKASATDNVSIDHVEFYNGNTLLFSDPAAPYEYTWNSVGQGLYSLRAKAFDNTGAATVSPLPVIVSVVAGGDSTPPAAITNLSVSSPSSSSLTLSWTAPGDDGGAGTASSYDIRRAGSPITSSNWADATQVAGEPSPGPAGTAQSFTVGGLSSSATYYFAIRTADEASNLSGVSNSPGGTTSASGSGTTLFSDDFNDGNANDWTADTAPTWAVVNSEYKTSNPGATKVSTAGSTAWENYTLEARVRLGNSNWHRTGLRFYCQDQTAGYRVEFAPSETNNVIAYLMEDATQIASVNLSMTFQTYQNVKIVAANEGATDVRIKLFINDVEKLNHLDSTASYASGKIGVSGGSWAVGYVDDVSVTGAGAQPPAASLAVWLRADAGITETGGAISGWADQSGQAHDAFASGAGQPTLVADAVNGRPAVLFDGTSDFLTLANGGITSANHTYQVFAVVKPGTGITESATVVAGGTNSFMYCVNPDGRHSLVKTNAAVLGYSSGSLVPTSSYSAISGSYAQPASSLGFWLNGAANGAGSSTHTFSGAVLYVGAKTAGSAARFKGHIAEVLVYTSVLTATDRQQVEAYLSSKYGL